MTSSRGGGFVTVVLALPWRTFVYYCRGVVCVDSLAAYVGGGLVVVAAGVVTVAGGGAMAARSA